jgi:hypothetical protein
MRPIYNPVLSSVLPSTIRSRPNASQHHRSQESRTCQCLQQRSTSVDGWFLAYWKYLTPADDLAELAHTYLYALHLEEGKWARLPLPWSTAAPWKAFPVSCSSTVRQPHTQNASVFIKCYQHCDSRHLCSRSKHDYSYLSASKWYSSLNSHKGFKSDHSHQYQVTISACIQS